MIIKKSIYAKNSFFLILKWLEQRIFGICAEMPWLGWQYDELTKWRVDKMTSWQNDVAQTFDWKCMHVLTTITGSCTIKLFTVVINSVMQFVLSVTPTLEACMSVAQHSPVNQRLGPRWLTVTKIGFLQYEDNYGRKKVL